jgi:hypothetical protein
VIKLMDHARQEITKHIRERVRERGQERLRDLPDSDK